MFYLHISMNSNSNLERIKIFILKSAMIIWSQVLIFWGIQYFKVKHKLVHRMSDLALFILNSNSRMCLAQIKFSYINKWVKETKKCLNAFLCSHPGCFRTTASYFWWGRITWRKDLNLHWMCKYSIFNFTHFCVIQKLWNRRQAFRISAWWEHALLSFCLFSF